VKKDSYEINGKCTIN